MPDSPPLPRSAFPQPTMSRDSILSKIRSALADVETKAEHPGFEDAAVVSRVRLGDGSPIAAFTRNFEAVHGRVMRHADPLVALLKEQGRTFGYCDPELMNPLGHALTAAGCTVETRYDRTRYDDYEFGITRATAAIAETGSLVLDDARTSDRLAALSPWIHVAVLREEEVHATLPEAIAGLGNSRNIIWVTGPSKTADVEGILIEGVHGPGEQIAFFLD